MLKIIFLSSSILWGLSTGIREGCMWTDDYKKRLSKSFKYENIFLGYHFWRNVEYFSVILMILSYNNFLLFGLGSWMFSIFFIYERVLQYVQYNELFHSQSDYSILKWEIPIRNKHYNLISILGIILMIVSIIFI